MSFIHYFASTPDSGFLLGSSIPAVPTSLTLHVALANTPIDAHESDAEDDG